MPTPIPQEIKERFDAIFKIAIKTSWAGETKLHAVIKDDAGRDEYRCVWTIESEITSL